MDPRFQTSFIPKKPIVTQTKSRTSSPINLFSLIGGVLFIMALAASGGAFFYKDLLAKKIVAAEANLDFAKGDFEPETINMLVRLDTRIKAASEILSSHIAVTPLFDFIGKITLKTVRFEDFNFSYLAKDKVLVTMRGQAMNYAAVALQSDLFNKQRILKDTTVSSLALDQSGYVTFNVSTTIDPTLFTYVVPDAVSTTQLP